MTKPILEQPPSSGLLWRISPPTAVSIFAARRQEEIFALGGRRNRLKRLISDKGIQGNPSPIPLISLAPF
jgi:hypothetical protein